MTNRSKIYVHSLFSFIFAIPIYIIRLILFNKFAIKVLFHRVDVKKFFNKDFISFQFRPIYPILLPKKNDDIGDYSDYAILIQGPLVNEYDFTFKTIEFYFHNFNGIYIILSTWSIKQIPKYLRDSEKFIVVENNNDFNHQSKISWDTTTNMNKQIFSTRSGLEVAKKLGVTKIIKTRSDFRFYENNFIDFLEKYYENFRFTNSSNENYSKIIFLDHNTVEDIPFHFDDTFQFGLLSEICLLWDVKLIDYSDRSHCSFNFFNEKYGEVDIQAYVFLSYCFKRNLINDNNFEKDFIHDNLFVFVPRETLGTYWFKYQVFEDIHQFNKYYPINLNY